MSCSAIALGFVHSYEKEIVNYLCAIIQLYQNVFRFERKSWFELLQILNEKCWTGLGNFIVERTSSFIHFAKGWEQIEGAPRPRPVRAKDAMTSVYFQA